MFFRCGLVAICFFLTTPLATANTRRPTLKVVERFPVIQKRPTQKGPYRIVTPENKKRVDGLMVRRENIARENFESKERSGSAEPKTSEHMTHSEYRARFPKEDTPLTKRKPKPKLKVIKGGAPQQTSFLPEHKTTDQRSEGVIDFQSRQQRAQNSHRGTSEAQHTTLKQVFNYDRFSRPSESSTKKPTSPKAPLMRPAAYRKALRAIDKLPTEAERLEALDTLNGLTIVKNMNGKTPIALEDTSSKNGDDYTERLTKVIEDTLGSGVHSFRIVEKSDHNIGYEEAHRGRLIEVSKIVSWKKHYGDFEVEIALESGERVVVPGHSLMFKCEGTLGLVAELDSFAQIRNVAEITRF